MVIDECHRSAWGKWSQVLTRNKNAVQIGLTATPRKLSEILSRQVQKYGSSDTERLPQVAQQNEGDEHSKLLDATSPYTVSREVIADAEITANNLKYFGEAAYEYDIAQAIEDGYLAACEIQRGRINLDDTGITKEEIIARNPVDHGYGNYFSSCNTWIVVFQAETVPA